MSTYWRRWVVSWITLAIDFLIELSMLVISSQQMKEILQLWICMELLNDKKTKTKGTMTVCHYSTGPHTVHHCTVPACDIIDAASLTNNVYLLCECYRIVSHQKYPFVEMYCTHISGFPPSHSAILIHLLNVKTSSEDGDFFFFG